MCAVMVLGALWFRSAISHSWSEAELSSQVEEDGLRVCLPLGRFDWKRGEVREFSGSGLGQLTDCLVVCGTIRHRDRELSTNLSKSSISESGKREKMGVRTCARWMSLNVQQAQKPKAEDTLSGSIKLEEGFRCSGSQPLVALLQSAGPPLLCDSRECESLQKAGPVQNLVGNPQAAVANDQIKKASTLRRRQGPG